MTVLLTRRPPRAHPQQTRTVPLGRRVARAWPHYLSVTPYYLLFLAFGAFPVVYTMYLAFQDWNGLGPMHYVGLRNFDYLLHDQTFGLALFNTFVIWVFSTVPMLCMSMVIAVMLNSVRRLGMFYKVAYFLPNVTSLVAMAILFGSLFSNHDGLVNAIVEAMGGSPIGWLRNPWAIKVTIASLGTWQWVGYNAIIYLAGLQAVPGEIYEAAKVDGAGVIRTFFSITLPQLRPVVLFTVIMSTIGGLQSFTEAQVLTSANATSSASAGGPGQAGLTMVLYFYSVAFNDNRLGYGAALAWGIFVIVLLVTLVNWLLTRERRT